MKAPSLSQKQGATVLATVVLVTAIVLSSFFYLNSQNSYAGDMVSVTVGMVNHEYASLIYIAQNERYFADNGINLTIKTFPNGGDAVNAMLSGQVDVSVATEFVVVQEALKDAGTYSFASIAKVVNLFIVTRTDTGITNASGLKGKTVGVALGTLEQFYLGRYLDLNGINQTQVALVNVPFLEQGPALANGTVDAVITFQPFLGQAETLLGNSTVMWPAQAAQPDYTELICAKAWAPTHAGVIERFLKSMVSSETFNINHPDQARAAVAKDLNYTTSYMASVWPDYQFSVALEQSFVLLVENEARWLINNNLTNATSVPNILNYIYLDGLVAVKPESVNIIP